VARVGSHQHYCNAPSESLRAVQDIRSLSFAAFTSAMQRALGQPRRTGAVRGHPGELGPHVCDLWAVRKRSAIAQHECGEGR
jgi:hypothetical protein